MSRAQIISKTIKTFNILRNQTDDLFLEAHGYGKAEIMGNELFESKLNPFLRELRKVVIDIPLNDYTVIAMDSWIKQLNAKIEVAKSEINNTNSLIIEYIPHIIDTLNEVKLELLELLLSENDNLEGDNKSQYRPIDSKSPLTPKGVALLIVQLQNFGVIRHDIPSESITELMAPLFGFEPSEIGQHISYDKDNRRHFAKVDGDDLNSLVKIMKSIIGRIENQQYVNEISKKEVD